jgi:hypothetical protein
MSVDEVEEQSTLLGDYMKAVLVVENPGLIAEVGGDSLPCTLARYGAGEDAIQHKRSETNEANC